MSTEYSSFEAPTAAAPGAVSTPMPPPPPMAAPAGVRPPPTFAAPAAVPAPPSAGSPTEALVPPPPSTVTAPAPSAVPDAPVAPASIAPVAAPLTASPITPSAPIAPIAPLEVAPLDATPAPPPIVPTLAAQPTHAPPAVPDDDTVAVESGKIKVKIKSKKRKDATSPSTTSPSTTSPSKTSSKDGGSRTKLLAGVAAVVAVGAIGWFAVGALTGDDAPTPPSDEALDPGAPASPILEPINDAGAAVDAINDNSGEEALLEELGLDPNGRAIPPGYRFSTTDMAGTALTVQVDTTTGNYSVESADGFGFRSLDGALVARTTAADEWTPVDANAVNGIQRFGLHHPVAQNDIITPDINAWVSVLDRQFDDGRETISYQVNVASANAEAPETLRSWAAPFGLDPAALITATSEPLMIEMVAGADGIVESFRIDVPGGQGTLSYQLETIYDEAPAISL